MARAPVIREDAAAIGQQQDHGSLRGTVAVVVVIGIIFVVVWIGVFMLFVARN